MASEDPRDTTKTLRADAPVESSHEPDGDLWTRAVVHEAVDGVITVDDEGRIEYLNPAAEEMFGYQADELAGQNITALMPMPHSDLHEAYMAHYKQTGQAKIIGTVRVVQGRRKDGRVFPLELSVSEVNLGDRRIFAGILHDITKRHRAQQEKDQLLRDLNKRNVELTCLLRVGECIRTRRVLSELFDDVVGLLRTGFLHPNLVATRIRFDYEIYESGPCRETPHHLVAPIVVAGRERGVIEVFYLEKTEGGHPPFTSQELDLVEGVAGSLGVTIESRDAETKVLQASKLASIGELAAGVGHEINNPVNGIINCADILLERLDENSKDHQFAELVRSEADRIARIVRNLLTFSRQDRERHSPARLCDVVEAVLSLSRKKIAKSHVELTVDVPADLPKLKCRSEQLQQVFMNLIINALHSLDDKYPQDNEMKKLNIIGIPIEFDGEPWVRLTIEDFGGGIAPVHMERLFDPFFTTKGRDRGTGLGLSVSDGIVKDHRGHISVDSELGQYARFHVDLPLDNGWQIEDDEIGGGGE